MSDRAATYDRPQGERSMGATIEAFKAVSGISITEEQGWLFMALLKAVRSQQGAYRADSYEDGAAYFALAGESAALTRTAPHAQAVPSPGTADTIEQLAVERIASEDPAKRVSLEDMERFVDQLPGGPLTGCVGCAPDDCPCLPDAELEKLERWKGAPKWAGVLLRDGNYKIWAQAYEDGALWGYVGEPVSDEPLDADSWCFVESRPCAN